MRLLSLLSLLSLLWYSTALQCDYFDPNRQPNNCDVTPTHHNHSQIDQAELENLKSLIASTSVTSFQLLYQNDLILSIGPSTHLDTAISLSQPFLLSLSSIIFSDSSLSRDPPFAAPLSKLTPDLKLDIPLHSYLSDILSLQTFDPLDDISWHGVNVSIALSVEAVPILEKILESHYREDLRHLVQKMRTVLGLESFRLDQTSEGGRLIRSTAKDILRFGNIVKTLMDADYSNFSAVYSHFPLRSADLILAFKEFQFGWWVNGAEYQDDGSNLFKLAPGDMIASMECRHNLYIVPSWDMVILTQRSQETCDSATDWLAEERSLWTQLPKAYTLKDSEVTRHLLGLRITGLKIVNNILFYILYCVVGHVSSAYVIKLFWDVSVMLSSETRFKHT